MVLKHVTFAMSKSVKHVHLCLPIQHFKPVDLANMLSSRSPSSTQHTLEHKLRVNNLHLPPLVVPRIPPVPCATRPDGSNVEGEADAQ